MTAIGVGKADGSANGSNPNPSTVDLIAASYNAVPYVSHPFAETQPERLAAIARLFGHEAPVIETARVLELGAASGGNLIPLAARYPNARFLGIDLAEAQVSAGQARIESAGLKNIELRHQSISEFSEGEFDYIICHGVYSWVPLEVRETILRICKERLSANGIAYVSYNVLPGWRMSQVIRDSLLLLVEGAPVEDRARLSREFLKFIAEHAPASGPYAETLRKSAEAFGHHNDDYITHEHLEGVNEPCTFTSFARALADTGLAYLGEAEFASMLPETWVGAGAPVDALRSMAGNDLIRTEQSIDILSGRTFRRSLLVHAEAGAMLRRSVVLEDFATLHFVPPLGLHRVAQSEEDVSANRVVFKDSAGRMLSTSYSSVAEGIDEMIRRIPASSAIVDLSPAGGNASLTQGRQFEVIDALFKMMTLGMISVAVRGVSPADARVAHPEATPLARADAACRAPFTASRRHEPVALDIIGHHVLPMMDGETRVQDMYARVLERARLNEIQFLRAGEPVTGDDALAAHARDHVDRFLAEALRLGLLAAAEESSEHG